MLAHDMHRVEVGVEVGVEVRVEVREDGEGKGAGGSEAWGWLPTSSQSCLMVSSV